MCDMLYVMLNEWMQAQSVDRIAPERGWMQARLPYMSMLCRRVEQ